MLERKGGVACTCPSHVPLLTWCQGLVVVPVRRRRPWVFPRGIRSHGVASTASRPSCYAIGRRSLHPFVTEEDVLNFSSTSY